MITVRLPETLRDGRGAMMTMSAASLDDIIERLDLADDRDELYNFAVNGELVIHGEHAVALKDGDEVEIVVAFSGG
jgi:sulfur carrier protein ThiS